MKKLIIIFTILSFPVLASANKSIKEVIEDWNVITYEQSGKKVCYMVSLPKKTSGNTGVRGQAYVAVSIFDDRKPEISVSSGYNFKPGSEVEFLIDSKKKFLATQIIDDIAWFKSTDLDLQVISVLQRGFTLNIKATNTLGKYSNDLYSLKGFTKAFEVTTDLCDKHEVQNKKIKTN
jgi:invasion protein IalB